MKYFIILNIIIVSCWSLPSISQLQNKNWIEFKNIHNKNYKSIDEEIKRFSIFENNLKKIEQHNEKYKNGLVTFKMGINQFADLTADEFLSYVTCVGGIHDTIYNVSTENENIFKIPPGTPLKKSIDWRPKGLVTRVKNQLDCSACWSFSIVGAIEGQYAKTTGTLVSLSEQNLIDCTISYGNRGCSGGKVSIALDYVKHNGIEPEELYPYIAGVSNCKFNKLYSQTSIYNHIKLESGNEYSLQQALSKIGPISIGLDVPDDMHLYKEGVYYNPECSSNNLKHAALVVGYGQDKNEREYFIVKNSWGPMWGDNGYIKIARNRNNHCGIATSAYYPLL